MIKSLLGVYTFGFSDSSLPPPSPLLTFKFLLFKNLVKVTLMSSPTLSWGYSFIQPLISKTAYHWRYPHSPFQSDGMQNDGWGILSIKCRPKLCVNVLRPWCSESWENGTAPLKHTPPLKKKQWYLFLPFSSYSNFLIKKTQTTSKIPFHL